MTIELAWKLAVAALLVRTFGRDALILLRRVAAAGVRAGVHQLHRDGTGGSR